MNSLQTASTQNTSVQSDWTNPDALVVRVNKMHEIMRKVMKPEIHYGKIPGCPQNVLLQPGSQLLSVAFCIGHDPRVEDLSGPDEIRYRVTDRVFDQKTGETITYGVGECSSNEEKYAWRRTSEQEYQEADPDRRRIKHYNNRDVHQVRTNPADVANTVLKMAHKRANVCGTINGLAASDIFTQDLEELPDGMDPPEHNTRSTMSEPTAADAPQHDDQQQAPNDEEAKAKGYINSKQIGFLRGKLKAAGVDHHAVENWLSAYRKIPGFKLWMVSWRKDRNITPKGAKEPMREMDYIIHVAEKTPEFFAKYAPVQQTAVNGPQIDPKAEAGNEPSNDGAPHPAPNAAAAGPNSGEREPSPHDGFEMGFIATLESRYSGGEVYAKSKEILSKFGYAKLGDVPAEKYGDIMAAASVAVK